MEELMCWNCMEPFEFDDKDIRPFIYHNCGDGAITGIRNPNFWKKQVRRRYIPTNRKRKHTLWQDF